ncbi:hypothetical protein CCACVL1_05953 [Corchorus capsularis]|uniref:Uncharacterized protein n=1 Tax=Corchorus capsularis TaxID=210143 RepID=A0A1R3JI55_COCAP|nr:hypothetical protein CCACVL1_05953 [Corchorus capsularis]
MEPRTDPSSIGTDLVGSIGFSIRVG